MAHEAHNFDIPTCSGGRVDECGTTVDIVSPETIDDGLYRLKSAFMEDEVTREDVHYVNCVWWVGCDWG